MIEEAMNRLPKPMPAKKKADITVQELAEIYEQVVRITENTLAFRKVNTLLIKDAPIDEGTVRLLQLLQEDYDKSADILNGLI